MDERWCRFRMGDAFPSGSVVSHWVAGLATIANDLLASNVVLVDADEKGNLSPEDIHHFYLACGHYREAAKFIADGLMVSSIQAFNASLPAEAQSHLLSIRSSIEPWKGSFVDTVLRPARDRLFHYPTPASSEWTTALAELADVETGVRTFPDQRTRDIRAAFADEIRATLVLSAFGHNPQAIGAAFRNLSQLMGAMVRFAHEALAAYLMRLPPDVLQIDD
jgi:hypothetical protein